MGSCHSFHTPFPPNYIAVTFRPTDELWICQGPPQFVDFIRSLLNQIWPHFKSLERHCDASPKHRRNSDGQPPPALRNTVFRIPTEPFTFSPIYQSIEVAESAHHFVTMMVAYLYSMDYEMVAAGHFVRGTEASTCLFRCKLEGQRTGSLHKLMGDCQIRRPTASKAFFTRPSKGLGFYPSKRMLVFGLEGWNRLYCINSTEKLVSELVKEFQKVWPQRIALREVKNSLALTDVGKKRGSRVDVEEEESSSFLIEFEGHPWDSYKEYSDLTPYLILTLINVLDPLGFTFECRANIRGLLDTLFFLKQDSAITASKESVIRICFSLCHQNTFRVYGGTQTFSTWITQLLQNLWLSGVASEKQISFSHPDHTEDGLHFTEIKLNGTPFCIPEWNKDNFLAAQYMIGRLIGVLTLLGWRKTAFLNVYSSPYDKGLLVFEKEVDINKEEKFVDLKVIEMRVRQEEDRAEDVKSFDLLRPVCFTSYDIDRLCILGGSRHFQQTFNNRFLRLFNTTKATYNSLGPKCHRKKKSDDKMQSTEVVDKDTFFSDGWIKSRLPYQPELLHKVHLSRGQSFICLLSPLNERLALTAIADLDPNNVLEYATNYQMWTASSCWPPKMFRKTSVRAKKFFHWSQIPLAVLCWANELINSSDSRETVDPVVDQEETSDKDEIVEVVSPNQMLNRRQVKPSYTNSLITCLDCASTARNAPPAWIYLISDCNQSVIVENKNASLGQ